MIRFSAILVAARWIVGVGASSAPATRLAAAAAPKSIPTSRASTRSSSIARSALSRWR
jgi:hypothetical protein